MTAITAILRAHRGQANHIKLVDLGQQPCPGFPAGACVEPLVLWGIWERGIASCLPTVQVAGRTARPWARSAPRRAYPFIIARSFSFTMA